MVLNKSDIINIVNLHSEELNSLGVASLRLFGSFVKEKQTDTSDVDVLIEFQPNQKKFDNFMELAFLLEELFHRKVELVTSESLSIGMKKSILESAEYVFRRN